MSTYGLRLWLQSSVIALAIGVAPSAAWAQSSHPAQDPGFQPNRVYLSELPFEHIDTLSGGLILSFTDLVLLGDAGRDLAFQRTYNSKSGEWTFGVAGLPLRIVDPPRPVGNTPGPQEHTPQLIMSDGSVRKMAWFVTPDINQPSTFDVTVSKDFWKLNRNTGVLSIPNGDTCLYEQHSANLLRLQSCTSAFGSTLEFDWGTGESTELIVTQHVRFDTRVVTINIDGGSSRWNSLTYENKTWTYGLDPVAHTLLQVTPPEGAPWSFTYYGALLETVTTPNGGTVAYHYGSLGFDGLSPVVLERETSGPAIAAGTWTYAYDFGAVGTSAETVVSTPSGRVTYTYGWTVDPATVFDGLGGVVPLASKVVEQSVGGNWQELEREQRTYQRIPVLSWGTFGALTVATRTVIRDGATTSPYVTNVTYNTTNFGDFHQPASITETGPAGTRQTTRTYQHLTAKYVVGLPLTEATTVGGQTFQNSWTYNAANGFRTSQSLHGIVTTFTADGFGNVAAITNANNKRIDYLHQYGQIQKITTAAYAVVRAVNADGSIASETRAGRTTTFGYDGLGRLVSTHLPGGTNPILIEYDASGEWVRTRRGTAQTTSELDGFGQVIRTFNALNVTTTTEYDAEGRIIREGYPFQPGSASGGVDIGTLVTFDALGRVTLRVNPDSSYSTRAYEPGGIVRLRDENNRTTVQLWQAFGDPDDQRLAGMSDAANHTWAYTYNALGRLTSVVAQDGRVRTWTYDARGLLQAETHPESGTTHHVFDASGMLVTRTDGNGLTTVFSYDGNDRLSAIHAGGRVTTITYEPGTDNRRSAANPSSATNWIYEPDTGRVHLRQDSTDGRLFTTRFEYDDNDALSAVVYPSGRRIQYERNVDGQPTRIADQTANRNYAANITYHPSGGVASYLSSNGITSSIAYDPNRYWVSGIQAGSALELTYANYDGVGNPLSVTDGRPSYSQSFAYDAVDRLSSASGPYGSSSFTYDMHGNRSGTNYQYDAATMRLMNQNGVGYTYDANGNTLTAGGRSFTYSPQNQVESVSGTASATYVYNVDEERVRKTANGSSTYYIRGASELLTEWTDPGLSTGRIRDYIYLGSRLIASATWTSSVDPEGINSPGAKSHQFATSWQVPTGSGGEVWFTSGISSNARKSMHPDMPGTGLRLGVQPLGWVDMLTPGPAFPNTSALPKRAAVFLEFEVERYPFGAAAEWLATDGGGTLSSSTDDLRLYLTSTGHLTLKHDGARTTPQTLWVSAEPIGLRTSHTLELRFQHNTNPTHPLPNPVWEGMTSWVHVYFDDELVGIYGATQEGGTWSSAETSPLGLDIPLGTTALSNVKLKSPGPTNGLLMNVWRFGLASGNLLDKYGVDWRTTLLEAAGPGTHSQWTGGQADWRARASGGGTGAFMNPVTTATAGQRISYQMESMASKGITGKISTVLVGVRMSQATTSTKAFIRRNGMETTLTDMLVQAGWFKWYRVAASGWLASDNIEVGITSGGTLPNGLNSVALIVEHNTPEPQPETDNTVRSVTVNYTGNGGAQTIPFNGIDQVPTALFVMPVSGTTGAKPIWWWNTRLGAAPFDQSIVGYGRIWPRRGQFHVVHGAGESYNTNGVNYVAIAIFDPAGRFVIPFGLSKPLAEDSYIHRLKEPLTGELAATFTPDFVFGGAAFNATNDPWRASYYRGPGHVGDATAALGVTQASAADRIQALGAGTVEFGTTIGHGMGGDMAFWAGRVHDGVSPTRLMAVTSYLGNGVASRDITLDLSGTAPSFVIVVPTNASAKVYRVSGDSSGRGTSSGVAVANSVTGMSINRITVGAALNAGGVTYDVWAIAPGIVPPY